MASEMGDTAVGGVKAYIEAQMSSYTGLEEKSKLIEQWIAICIYRVAAALSEGGNRVHLMYWAETPLIDNLGSGTVNATATLLGNSDALQMYGNVMNADLSEILQSMLWKFISGGALKLYHNEIVGIDAFDWKAFPKALIVSDGKLKCDMIEGRLKKQS